ncbi:MAG TPA: DUF502 domain-containing protein [Steroidobacteraceae bacterium]
MTGSVLQLILRRYLIAGLLVWLPIIATVLVVRFILNLLDQLLPRPLRPEVLLGVHIPGLGALVALVILLATGLLVTNIIGRSLVRAWEDVLNRIPFIRAVYGGVKSFSTTILSNSGNSFKKVLLIEYPRAGMWSVGFQTASDVQLSPAQGMEPLVCVFIPTTPNPTSGFIVMVPRSQAIELEMTVDAAMKMIVTLGVVMPVAHTHA